MSNLKDIVRDVVSKNLSNAKETINQILQQKAVLKIDSIKPSVAHNLVVEEEVDCDDEDDISELTVTKKRIDPKARKDAAKYYKKNKSKIKVSQRKYKKSSAGKKTARKAEIMKKKGKTSTGKRISKITN